MNPYIRHFFLLLLYRVLSFLYCSNQYAPRRVINGAYFDQIDSTIIYESMLPNYFNLSLSNDDDLNIENALHAILASTADVPDQISTSRIREAIKSINSEPLDAESLLDSHPQIVASLPDGTLLQNELHTTAEPQTLDESIKIIKQSLTPIRGNPYFDYYK